MFESVYKELGMNKYDVWYQTMVKKIKRRKSFATIEDLTKWLKINSDKVKITSGSSEVFRIMNSLKGIETTSNKNDLVWKYGKSNV